MLSDGNATQTLVKLGLTMLEARIYLALSKYGCLTTKALSGLTNTAQPDTYRVLGMLQKKGLVEKRIAKPALFKAVSMNTGLTFLLEKKKTEYDDLKVNTRLLIQEIKEKPARQPETIQNHFTLIPQRETVVKRIREAVDNAKKSVDLYLSWKRFSIGITSTFSESSQKAWNRGVNFRIVVESPTDAAGLKLAHEFCGKSPFCNLRLLPMFPKTVLGIYDKKEVFIIVDPRKGLFDSPALWSNNQSLISVAQDYFEMLWLTAIEARALGIFHMVGGKAVFGGIVSDNGAVRVVSDRNC
jgi:sugar-specific transcriptional regulator TrmB